MVEKPSHYRSWLLIGSLSGLIMGAGACLWDLLILPTVGVVFFIHVMILVPLWRVGYWRAMLLWEIAVAVLWLAIGTGVLLGTGDIDDDINVGMACSWLIVALGSLIILLPPRQRFEPADRAPLRDYFRFGLRGMFLLITLLAVIFGIASLPRSERWHIYHYVNDVGGSESFYQTGRSHLESWLAENGYTPAEYPGPHWDSPAPEAEYQWYARPLENGEVIYVRMIWAENYLMVDLRTKFRNRLLPHTSPQETECYHAARDMKQVWDKYKRHARVP